MAVYTYEIAASADDTSEFMGSADHTIGNDNPNTGGGSWLGFVWDTPDVAQGTTIDSAYMKWPAHEALNVNLDFQVYGEDEDSAADWSGNRTPSSASRTTATVQWTDSSGTALTAGQYVTSVDMKTIVQEIVNRAGYANRIAMVTECLTAGFYIRLFDGGGGTYAILEITTSGGGGGITVAEMAAMFSPQPEQFLAPEPVGIPY